MAEKQRDFGLDLVRAMAGVLVLAVHFFMNDGFYATEMTGKSMLLACMVRMCCMTCVPLFLLLTGYLCVNRKWSPGYYRKLLPILLTYLLAGGACMVFRIGWQGASYTPWEIVLQFTAYSAAPYGWYIGMYIGLFLLSPFLNAAWHGLDERGQKALMLTLIGLTALPTWVNQWDKILPEWWMEIYPLTFYVVGAWLREHPIKIKGWKLLLCWLGIAAAAGYWGYHSAAGGVYIWLPEDNWKSYVLLAQAVCLFSCLRQCKGERVPAPVRWCVARLAKLALPMYLVSYIADQLIYPVLNQAVPAAQAHQRIWWMPVVLPVVVVCSAVLAQLVDWAAEALMRLLPAGRPKGATVQKNKGGSNL